MKTVWEHHAEHTFKDVGKRCWKKKLSLNNRAPLFSPQTYQCIFAFLKRTCLSQSKNARTLQYEVKTLPDKSWQNGAPQNLR